MSLEDALKGLKSKMEEANEALRKVDHRSPDQKAGDALIDALDGLKPFIERAQEELEKAVGGDEPADDDKPSE